jgi:hypothetical protein
MGTCCSRGGKSRFLDSADCPLREQSCSARNDNEAEFHNIMQSSISSSRSGILVYIGIMYLHEPLGTAQRSESELSVKVVRIACR